MNIYGMVKIAIVIERVDIIEIELGARSDLDIEHGLSLHIEVDGKNILFDTGKIGGTHLVNEDDKKINRIIENLKARDIKSISACHCTGEKAKLMLTEQLGDKFRNNNTGDLLFLI